jgi:hypothetical protein
VGTSQKAAFLITEDSADLWDVSGSVLMADHTED